MEISLTLINDKVHFVAENRDGNTLHVDGSPAIGGEGGGFRPMELLLASIGACASMDLLPILRKQRQDVRQVSVSVRGQRIAGRTPAPFEKIEIAFTLAGEIDARKATRAARLAVEKYCSVAETLSPSVEISWTVTVLHGHAE